jgi:hypothetical protein
MYWRTTRCSGRSWKIKKSGINIWNFFFIQSIDLNQQLFSTRNSLHHTSGGINGLTWNRALAFRQLGLNISREDIRWACINVGRKNHQGKSSLWLSKQYTVTNHLIVPTAPPQNPLARFIRRNRTTIIIRYDMLFRLSSLLVSLLFCFDFVSSYDFDNATWLDKICWA